MPGQLIPPPEFDHPLSESLSMEERVALWLDLLEASEQMLIAGLRATLPDGADLRDAVRQVYERQSEEHFHALERIAEHFQLLEAEHGGTRGS
ncbi:MAG: hypothetical protein ACT4QC_00445 [Planctomycetaceae bacterium]